MLQSKDAKIRGDAVELFACDYVPESASAKELRASMLSYVTTLMGDTSGFVRAKAAHACGFLSEAERAGYTFDSKYSASDFLKKQRDGSLTREGPTPLSTYAGLLQDNTPAVPVAVLVTAHRLTPEERKISGLIPAVMLLLGDETLPTIISSAAAHLVVLLPAAEQVQCPGLDKALTMLSTDANVVSRRFLASRFSSLDESARTEHLRVLEVLLRDNEALVRGTAASQVRLLSYAERQSLIPQLVTMASSDQSRAVRHAATIGIDGVSDSVRYSLNVHMGPLSRDTQSEDDVPVEDTVVLPPGEFQRMATSDESGDRVTAASIFGDLSQREKDAAVDYYRQLFSDKDCRVRQQVASSFTMLRFDRKNALVGLVEQLLGDTEHDVRDSAARAIISLTVDGWPGLREHAPRALLEITRRERMSHMAVYNCLLCDGNPDVRVAAVTAFGHIDEVDRKQYLPLFLRRLSAQEPSVKVRTCGVHVIRQLSAKEKTLCLRSVLRHFSSLNSRGRKDVVQLIGSLELEERAPYLEKLAKIIRTDPSVEVRDLVLDTFLSLTTSEIESHNGLLLRYDAYLFLRSSLVGQPFRAPFRYVLSRRSHRGDALEKAVLASTCTAAETAAVVAVHDVTSCPGEMDWARWSAAACACVKFMELSHTDRSIRSVILATLQAARQTVPSTMEARWTEQLKAAAVSILDDISPAIRESAVSKGLTAPLQQAGGMARGNTILCALDPRALVPYLDNTDPSIALVMFALQIEYVKVALEEVVKSAALQVNANVRETPHLSLDHVREVLQRKGDVSHFTEIAPPVVLEVVTDGPTHRPSEAITRQEIFLDSISRQLPKSHIVHIASSLVEPTGSHNLKATAFMALQFPRPSSELDDDEVVETKTICGCMTMRKKRRERHDYLTFSKMLLDSRWNDVVASAIRRHRLRVRDVKLACAEFQRSDVCHASVAMLVQLDLYVKDIFEKQYFLRHLGEADSADDFFSRVTKLHMADLLTLGDRRRWSASTQVSHAGSLQGTSSPSGDSPLSRVTSV